MTMSLSLEEQKKILLDRMEENRRNYRNNFIQQFSNTENSAVLSGDLEAFPRSHTFKLLTQHPYLISIALIAALAGSRGSLRNILKKNLAFSADMLKSKVKMLVVPAIIRLFRSYIRY
jgi:mannose/fructose/N-acetylgalactosamine-specific phosphotransferase system component IIC